MTKSFPLVLSWVLLVAGGCAMPQDRRARPWRETPRPRAARLEKPDLARAGAPKPQALVHLAVINPRKVVYTAALSVVVPDVRVALDRTVELARQHGGYMQRLTNKSVVIRVPAEKFDPTITSLERLGAVAHRDIQASDVTEDYIDLEVRLRSAQALLDKLLALLQKAKDVKEALAVEQEIARVRAQIERLTGQLNRLRNQVTYATISVTFVALQVAPEEFKTRLPFLWLRDLGVEKLMRFRPGTGGTL